jgi:hypothetical protein
MAAHAPLARRPPRLRAAELLVGLVYHVSQEQGTLAGHLEDLTGQPISDSAASQRRLAMPWAIFEAILEHALVPLADAALQPAAFYSGYRLVGIDGTQFSLSNTPRVLGVMTKAASRRFEAAFAKLGCSVLVELGTHAPLAAAIAEPAESESEAELAAQVLGRLPAESLLLADRFYGNGAFIARLLACAPAGPEQAFLLRVSQTPRPKLIEELADGSTLVEVRLAREEAELLGAKTILTRELRGRVRRPGGAWREVRLWTNLLDTKAHPALALLALYARRWEQELAYHELKVDLRASGKAPLASHTPETAAQEIAALLLALCLLAGARLQAAQQAGVSSLRASFGCTLAGLRPLWEVLSVGGDLLSADQRRALTERVIGRIAKRLLPLKRRQRGCPRAVRQSVKSWPRMTKPEQHKGEWHYELSPKAN